MKVDAKTCRAGTRHVGFSDRAVNTLEMRNEEGVFVHIADIELQFDFGREVAEVAAAAVAEHFKKKAQT